MPKEIHEIFSCEVQFDVREGREIESLHSSINQNVPRTPLSRNTLRLFFQHSSNDLSNTGLFERVRPLLGGMAKADWS
jgi:hypothetical protein